MLTGHDRAQCGTMPGMKDWQIDTLIGIAGGLFVGLCILGLTIFDGGSLTMPGK